MRIPFDSLSLAAVVAELQPLVGCALDQVSQLDDSTIVLSFYDGSPFWVLISSDPVYFRAHILTRRPAGIKPAPTFCLELRKRLEEAKVSFVRQRGLDRILEIGFKTPHGNFVFVAELMGKHSNLMLLDPGSRVVAAAKWIGATKSRRPVLPNVAYAKPPFEPKPSLLGATVGDHLMDFEGVSPFLAKVIESGADLFSVQEAFRRKQFNAVYCHGSGAYPISVANLIAGEVPRRSFSQALEQHFEATIESDKVTQLRANLKSQLERVLLAREVAIDSLEEAIENARTARHIQVKGELILAYQANIVEGSRTLDCYDYEGEPIVIQLRADLTPAENAERYFTKAKQAKARINEVIEQRERVELDRVEISNLLQQLEACTTSDCIQDLIALADKKNWTRRSGVALAKEERPYEGHSIRELISPGGWKVLYGTNATSNDYLTGKVAKPADIWLHVRGAPSAHVVICTNNQPAKVQKADIEFAAKVSVRNSSAKHSGYVSVDFVQKRYVRKPRGSAPGAASYTNEKTIHVTDD